MRAALILYVLGSLMAAFLVFAAQGDELGCITDTECQALCPPPMDDPNCDGGPRPAYQTYNTARRG